jgi:hypothetical protein
MKCPDCGCSMSNGLCSNCQEEAFIIENQYEYIDFELSDDFIKKAKNQFKQRENNKNDFKQNIKKPRV